MTRGFGPALTPPIKVLDPAASAEPSNSRPLSADNLKKRAAPDPGEGSEAAGS